MDLCIKWKHYLFRLVLNHFHWVGWLVFNNSNRDKDETTVGVGHSRRYCNTGYDQSQGRRPSTLKCIGPISKGDIEPQPSSQKLIRNRTDREATVSLPAVCAIPGRPVSDRDHA